MLKNKTQKIFNSFIIILLVGFFIPFFIQAEDGEEVNNAFYVTETESENTTNSTTNYYDFGGTGSTGSSNSTLEGVSTDGQAVYTLLETSLPGIPDATGGLGGYLEGIFGLAIGIASVLAVLMIVIGGFQYITSEAVSSTTEAKKRIMDALLGLVLVLASWLILNTINTDLVNFNTNLDPVEYNTSPGTTTSETPQDCWCKGNINPTCVTSNPNDDSYTLSKQLPENCK